MRIQIQLVTNPVTRDIYGAVEIFDPRVVPARAAQEAIPADEATGRMAVAAVPAFLGTVSCLVRFYDPAGNFIAPVLRNSLTELTPEQYAGWTADVADDTAYFAACILANLGLTKAA